MRRARAQRLTASVSVTGDQSGPPARWGASYGQQFAILFARSVKVRQHPVSPPAGSGVDLDMEVANAHLVVPYVVQEACRLGAATESLTCSCVPGAAV